MSPFVPCGKGLSPAALLGLIAALALSLAGVRAQAAQATLDQRVVADDGVSIHAQVGSDNSFNPLPAIVEFSPYAPGCCPEYAGPNYNYVQVDIRGTGDSDGRFDSLGERTQKDVVEVLNWACTQSWSNGQLAVFGFSASAITFYNSLHYSLPCVKTAVMWSGTYELYRDLINPGGINNTAPDVGVLGLIGTPTLLSEPARLGRNPLSTPDAFLGLGDAFQNAQANPTLDAYWQERGFRRDVNHLPILMVDGFFDVESRGAFQAYQGLRGDGAHLMVIGAHDGEPAGTNGAREAEDKAWFDHYLGGINNGVELHPRAQLWMSDGSREDDINGDWVHYNGTDWPIPGTTWVALALDPTRSGTAHSLNDGTLGLTMPSTATTQSYPTIPTLPTASDQPNTAILGGNGINAAATAFPLLTETTLAEPYGLSYTSKPLLQDVLSAGPVSLELELSSTAGETDIWAVIADVWPDATPHPVATGRLRSSFPLIDQAKSLKDSGGNIVEPYGKYDVKSPVASGVQQRYYVEFWPIGNRFRTGHRVRLDIVGLSAASAPAGLALNSIVAGGVSGSLLRFPVLPGSDLTAALGGP